MGDEEQMTKIENPIHSWLQTIIVVAIAVVAIPLLQWFVQEFDEMGETKPADVKNEVKELRNEVRAALGMPSVDEQPLLQPNQSRAEVGDIEINVNEPQSSKPPTLTTEQVADQLGVNADTVRRRHDACTLFGYYRIGWNAWVKQPRAKLARNEPEAGVDQE